MAYTAATKLPTLKEFQWSRPSAPNPRLDSPISATDTTITVTSPSYDYDGSTLITGGFVMGIKKSNGYVEHVYVPSGASSDGMTFTGCVRGVRLAGLDYTTGDTALAVGHDQDSVVFCNVAAVKWLLMLNTMQGSIATGANNLRIGDLTDSNVTIYAQNADANKPFVRYDAASNQWVYSNDGTSSTGFGTGAGVTGGDGITVTAGDIDIDLSDTVIFKSTSAGAGDSGKVARLNGSGVLDQTFLPGTITQVTRFDALRVNEAVTVTTTSTEINRLAGISANVTAANLNTLTGGGNADALHTHGYTKRALSFTSAVTVSNTTSETTIISGTITGGSLGINGILLFEIDCSQLVLNTGSSVTVTIRAKYGATTVATITLAGSAITAKVGRIQGYIMNAGVTNSQKASMTFINDPTDNTFGGATAPSTAGTAAEDSTANKTFAVTCQFSSASANANATFQHGYVTTTYSS